MTQSSASPENAVASGHRQRIPVTVVLERRMVSRSFWRVPVWRLHGVLVGEHLSPEPVYGQSLQRPSRAPGRQVSTVDPAPDAVATPEPAEVFSRAGFSVTLYRDACERYWHALIGDQPRVYVICHAVDDQATLKPVKVTVNYDEAIAYGDTDQQVLSAPIPAELYRHMETFVLQHYKPQVFKKRKRRDWEAESERATGTQRS